MKKIFCILLIMAMLTSLVACADPGNDGDGDGGDGDVAYIENADILAYSYDRIENADLSFNMSMGGEAVGSGASAEATLSSMSDTVVVTNSGEAQWIDFFSSQDSTLETTRRSARQICDFVLENVTVVNKIVYDNGMNYLLQYEGDNVLTVYSFFGGVDGSSLEKAEGEESGESEIESDESGSSIKGIIRDLVRIQFYYDENGDETVSYFNYGIDESDPLWLHSSEIVYTPGKHYEIKSYSCEIDPETLQMNKDTEFLHYIAADRSTGKWQGMSWYCTRENTLFTKEGSYDYANNQVVVDFMFETDSGLMSSSGGLVVYRDGNLIRNEVAEPDDVIVLETTRISNEMFGAELNDVRWMFGVSLPNLNGWSKVVLDRADEQDPYHLYLRGEGDYIEFTNGKKMYGSNVNSTVWIDGVGFVYSRHKEVEGGTVIEYVDENGVSHDSEWFVEVGGADNSKTISFSGETYVDRETDTSTGFALSAVIFDKDYNSGTVICEDPIGLFKKFYDYVGFTSKLCEDDGAVFEDTKDFYENCQQYMDSLFRQWHGINFDHDGMLSHFFATFDAYRAKLTAYNTFVEDHEIIDSSKQPKLPDNFALISLSGGVKGSVKVSESGLDLSALNVSVAKNILLGDQNKYGVCVALVGKTSVIVDGAFTSMPYANEDMTLTGNSGVAHPALSEGEYVLSLYFGRETENGIARFSELVVPKVDSFTTFEKRFDAPGGCCTATYTYDSGALKVSVSYADTQAPSATFTSVDDVGGELLMTLVDGAKVSDLLSNVVVTDNRDGVLIITAENVELMNGEEGNAVNINDSLSSNTSYRISYKDSSGNEGSVTVKVMLRSE